MTTTDKAAAFQALHQRDRAFVIPNPWDVGSARLLADLGYEALATTSAGFAFSRGQPDYGVGRDAMLAHVAEIVCATDLPVSADLENGFGDRPEDAAETIRQGKAVGLCGASIEDATGRDDDPIYALDLAVERVRAAAQAALAGPAPFTLTARCENHLVGRPDLADTIRRLQRYAEAGADVLYAPGLRTREDITTVVRAVGRPVNVLMGMAGMTFTVDDLSAMGVRRISVGSALSRAALGAFLRAARTMRDHGTFSWADEAEPYRDLEATFRKFPPLG